MLDFDAGWSEAPREARQLGFEPKALWTMAALLVLVPAARDLPRRLRRRRAQASTLPHPTKAAATARAAQTILEAPREAPVHARDGTVAAYAVPDPSAITELAALDPRRDTILPRPVV